MIVSMLGIQGLEKTSPEFRSELWRVANRLGLDPSYIAAVMSHESGFNPAAKNPNGGATGLIQFMPNTATGLGTSVSALLGMSAEEQLQYVEKFFRPYAHHMRKDVPGDYLMATFMPAFIGEPPETVLFARGEKGYVANVGFDHAGKGAITVGDVISDIDKIVAKARTLPSIEVDTTLPLGGAGSLRPSPSLFSPPQFFSGPSGLPVLRAGSRGLAVVLWQRFLNHTAVIGATVNVSGVFDEMTASATEKYQVARGLQADRIVGQATWSTVFS